MTYRLRELVPKLLIAGGESREDSFTKILRAHERLYAVRYVKHILGETN
jgi:hypothetical protein